MIAIEEVNWGLGVRVCAGSDVDLLEPSRSANLVSRLALSRSVHEESRGLGSNSFVKLTLVTFLL